MSMSIGSASDISQAFVELRSAAQRLEIGQGHTPLADAIDDVLADKAHPALGVVVAASSADARDRVLAWLGVMEGALEAGSPSESVREIASMQAHGQPIRIFAPLLSDTRETIRDLLRSMADIPTILLAALAPGGEPSSEVLETLALLSEAALGWAAVDFGAGVAETVNRLPGVALRTVTIGEQSSEELLDGNAGLALWQSLQKGHDARRAHRACDLIQERQQSELRQLTSRQKREQNQEGAVEGLAGDAEARQRIDGMKSAAASELAALAQDLRERGRRAGLRKGEIFGLIEELLGNLRASDLEQEVAGKKIRLTLRTEVADELRNGVGEALKALVVEDCGQIGQRLDHIERRLKPDLARLGLPQRQLHLSAPLVDQFWTAMEEGLHLQGRYRGEIPKRGFLQRLGEGRRVVFLVLMVGSLFGGFMGFNIRRAAAMGPIFLLLFLGVFLYTFISWRKDEAVVFDDELIRLKDILSSEFSRLISDALRERQMRLHGAYEDIRKDIFASLDAVYREASAARVAAQEGERKLSRSRQKLLDQRLREIQALAPSLLKARQALERQIAELSRQIQKEFAPQPAAAPQVGR